MRIEVDKEAPVCKERQLSVDPEVNGSHETLEFVNQVSKFEF
jgi:hypothetical protein